MCDDKPVKKFELQQYQPQMQFMAKMYVDLNK